MWRCASAQRAVVANVRLVWDVRRVHDVRAGVGLAKVERVDGDELARQRERVEVEREALRELQRLAVDQAARERPRPYADRMNDEHVVLPAPDRMPREARLEVGGMLGPIEVNGS